jgi:nicotinate-nucleotide pyrophosphorylase (carboxylating)
MDGTLPGWVVQEAVARALAEDVGPGDVTTLAIVGKTSQCTAEVVAKADGVIAGLAVAQAAFAAVDPRVTSEAVAADGDRVKAGSVVARVQGPTRAVLTAERTALNFLQRMSGIATLTARYVSAVEGTTALICDTRKTVPGLRLLDKYSVRVGGGENHRTGLFDGVLIKDNHIRAAGGLREAVERARRSAHHLAKIEVEAQSLPQVEEALTAGADVIMLDNLGLAEIRRAVNLIGGRCLVEASGGVTLETVRELAECGVDLISVGALTHSSAALDLSLEIRDTAG